MFDPQQRVELVARLVQLSTSSKLAWDKNGQSFNFVAKLRDLYFEAKRQGMGLDPVDRVFRDLDSLG